jgi:hypothetical protein
MELLGVGTQISRERAMRARGNPFDRANQELKNAFLDESLAQKEPKLWPWKVGTLFTILSFCMPI